MNTNSWIDLELSYAFAGMVKPDSEIVLESGLPDTDEIAIAMELARIERIIEERKASLFTQDAAKARAYRVLRRHRVSL